MPTGVADIGRLTDGLSLIFVYNCLANNRLIQLCHPSITTHPEGDGGEMSQKSIVEATRGGNVSERPAPSRTPRCLRIFLSLQPGRSWFWGGGGPGQLLLSLTPALVRSRVVGPLRRNWFSCIMDVDGRLQGVGWSSLNTDRRTDIRMEGQCLEPDTPAFFQTLASL